MIVTKDYGSRYYVTTHGQVFTKEFSMEIINQTGATGKFKVYPEKELKGSINTFGYKQVNVDNTLKCIHRIVAQCFIENPNNLPEVNHKDGDKLNNSASNLEWCTRAQNVQHSYDTGLNTGNFGADNGKTLLTEDEVMLILQEYSNGGISQRELGLKYGVKQITISNIITGRSWSHVSKLQKKKKKKPKINQTSLLTQ